MTSTQVANFGAGCLTFRVPNCQSVTTWFSQVENALSRLASIDEIQVVNRGNEFAAGCTTVDYDNGSVESFMQPSAGGISFKVAIPERLQKGRTSGIGDGHATLGATEFRVYVQFEYYGPVTFVECLNSRLGDEALGSEGVIIVREHLKSELDRAGGAAELVVVGPSPFHVDFRVTVIDDVDPGDVEVVRVMRRPGYDLCEFTFYGDYPLSQLKEEIAFEMIGEELSVFYELVRGSNEAGHELQRLNGKLGAIISSQQRKGVRASLARIFRTPKQARELMLELVHAELASIGRSQWATESIESVTNYRGRVLFLDKMQAQASDTYLGELHLLRDAASILEAGRAKEFEIAVIAASTLLGGIAGALAALLAG